ncbi:hypothetical protein M430DRAFT_58444 [Amorphotheca resinae ATCC 22711]|uniref:Uncharacterized protein n=1 Tax=Amorphotheca resinae ATCC 22711 TaxID=857342 RepID=A0A2T3B4T6_AMORE|nr:hypothetical protein M430DRAFT_58444 [Amorphotheca resinae ATCC 22711]PSS20650.1 hypothetical protein M430DRAFT_58444 [Amorphotheca resinae ATCC 22711]
MHRRSLSGLRIPSHQREEENLGLYGKEDPDPAAVIKQAGKRLYKLRARRTRVQGPYTVCKYTADADEQNREVQNTSLSYQNAKWKLEQRLICHFACAVLAPERLAELSHQEQRPRPERPAIVNSASHGMASPPVPFYNKSASSRVPPIAYPKRPYRQYEVRIRRHADPSSRFRRREKGNRVVSQYWIVGARIPSRTQAGSSAHERSSGLASAKNNNPGGAGWPAGLTGVLGSAGRAAVRTRPLSVDSRYDSSNHFDRTWTTP